MQPLSTGILLFYSWIFFFKLSFLLYEIICILAFTSVHLNRIWEVVLIINNFRLNIINIISSVREWRIYLFRIFLAFLKFLYRHSWLCRPSASAASNFRWNSPGGGGGGGIRNKCREGEGEGWGMRDVACGLCALQLCHDRINIRQCLEHLLYTRKFVVKQALDMYHILSGMVSTKGGKSFQQEHSSFSHKWICLNRNPPILEIASEVLLVITYLPVAK